MDILKQLRGQWDRVGAIALTLLGALFLIIGWVGVSGKALMAEQTPYVVSGGLGGIFLVGVGAALWLSADLRDEWVKLDRIERVLESSFDRLTLERGPDGWSISPGVQPGEEAIHLRRSGGSPAAHSNGSPAAQTLAVVNSAQADASGDA